jgi:hypothetical protein
MTRKIEAKEYSSVRTHDYFLFDSGHYLILSMYIIITITVEVVIYF